MSVKSTYLQAPNSRYPSVTNNQPSFAGSINKLPTKKPTLVAQTIKKTQVSTRKVNSDATVQEYMCKKRLEMDWTLKVSSLGVAAVGIGLALVPGAELVGGIMIATGLAGFAVGSEPNDDCNKK